MQDVFPYEISSVTEMGLAANTGTPLPRLKWKTVNGAGKWNTGRKAWNGAEKHGMGQKSMEWAEKHEMGQWGRKAWSGVKNKEWSEDGMA